MESPLRTAERHECRQCCSFCERLLHPSGCLESNCRYLYVYDDEDTGRRFMGCLNKVFKVEIDMELFREAERTRLGYGAVKMTGTPISNCKWAVEAAYDGDGDAFDCVNPRFFDDADVDEDAAGAFDLRDGL